MSSKAIGIAGLVSAEDRDFNEMFMGKPKVIPYGQMRFHMPHAPALPSSHRDNIIEVVNHLEGQWQVVEEYRYGLMFERESDGYWLVAKAEARGELVRFFPGLKPLFGWDELDRALGTLPLLSGAEHHGHEFKVDDRPLKDVIANILMREFFNLRGARLEGREKCKEWAKSQPVIDRPRFISPLAKKHKPEQLALEEAATEAEAARLEWEIQNTQQLSAIEDKIYADAARRWAV